MFTQNVYYVVNIVNVYYILLVILKANLYLGIYHIPNT